MLRGLYNAGSALESAAFHQDLLAENLAHASTPGYRRQGYVYESLQQGLLNPGAPAAAGGSGLYTSFEPGPLETTGHPYDFAITGDAFFVLEGPEGPVYTRNGSFQVSPTGELQNKSGLKVRGQGGAIVLPLDAARIEVTRDGAILANGSEVGRLDLAQFSDLRQLQRVGPTLFSGPSPTPPEPGTVTVQQGYREGSNVQVVQEMVGMMLGMRQYEAAEKTMRAIGEAMAQNTRPE